MRLAASLVLACTTSACIETHFHRSEAGDASAGDTTDGSTSVAPPTTSMGEGPTGPSTSGSATAPPGTSDSSGMADSSGSATDATTGGPTETCGNGEHEPGELCLGEVELVPFDPGAVDVVIGNVDDDLIVDLAVASEGTVSLRSGDGVGGYGNLESLDIMGTAVAIAAADLDHDDAGDAIALAQPLAAVIPWSNGWDFYQYAGNGQALDTFNDLVLGSFDYTYELDVVYTAGTQVVFQSGSKPAYTYQLAPPQLLPTSGGAPAGIASASFVFDGDGDADIVVVYRDSSYADIVRGGDDADFVLHGSTLVCPQGEVGARHVAIGDIDGDGFQDLVTTCAGDRFAVTVGNDDGTFAPPVAFDSADAFGVTLADLDGAGEIDVAIAAPSLGVVSVFVDRDGALELATELEVGEPIAGIDSADVDGDGSRDLAVAVPSGAVGLFRSDP